MDGRWQLGHVPAAQYAVRAAQAAKMMKDCDRAIETVACGSSGPMMPTFLEWDRAVLEGLGDLADHISLHRYVGNASGNSADYLAIGNSIDQQIEAVDACARLVRAQRRLKRRAYLCFDEWNVWYRARGGAHSDGRGRFAPPLIEERYNLEDALVVAAFLMSFIRHADCVKIANLAQLVNVIAPLRTEGDALLKQTIFHAFRMISERRSGVALHGAVAGPRYTSERYGEAAYLDQAAILDGDRLHLFAVNRSLEQPLPLTVDCAGFGVGSVANAEILHGELQAENTFAQPETVLPAEFDGWQVTTDGEAASTELLPHSLVATTFALRG